MEPLHSVSIYSGCSSYTWSWSQHSQKDGHFLTTDNPTGIMNFTLTVVFMKTWSICTPHSTLLVTSKYFTDYRAIQTVPTIFLFHVWYVVSKPSARVICVCEWVMYFTNSREGQYHSTALPYTCSFDNWAGADPGFKTGGGTYALLQEKRSWWSTQSTL